MRENANPHNLTKELKDPKEILNISEILDIQIANRCYENVSGFLVIHTAFLDTKNYFKINCEVC